MVNAGGKSSVEGVACWLDETLDGLHTSGVTGCMAFALPSCLPGSEELNLSRLPNSYFDRITASPIGAFCGRSEEEPG